MNRQDIYPFAHYIQLKLKEKYPDSYPDLYIIEQTIAELKNWITEKLDNEEKARIYGLGSFHVVKRRDEQYYLKFKYSRNFIMNYRNRKGTATDSELKCIERNKQLLSNTIFSNCKEK